ncbi:MAG: transglycosylase SLT domain-containing protein [Rubrivivax sp.]
MNPFSHKPRFPGVAAVAVSARAALLSAALLTTAALPLQAQTTDEPIVQAREALRKGNAAQLAAARATVTAAAHPLALWVDYWELQNRLPQAQQPELDAFYARWPGTYVEDRLRNDWLLELGKRRDWANLRTEFPRFRMNDDREVTCYALLAQHLDGPRPAREVGRDIARETARETARDALAAQRDADDGCLLMASTLLADGVLKRADIWRVTRTAVEMNRLRLARGAAALLGDGTSKQVGELLTNPVKFLNQRPAGLGADGVQLTLLALMRDAADDPQEAAGLVQRLGAARLPASDAAAAWAQIGKQAAIKQQPLAADWAREGWTIWNATSKPGPTQLPAPPPWSDDLLAWHVRAALREGPRTAAETTARWTLVQQAIGAMSPTEQQDTAWVYWKARATAALALPGTDGDGARAVARQALASIAPQLDFYGRLASEDLGRVTPLPAPPSPPTVAEREAVRSQAGLGRGLRLIDSGLRSEGVREWNFSLRGLDERQLLIASAWACERQVWDRCINTSERTRTEVDVTQRFPLPFRKAIEAKGKEVGLDPSLMYGLIRQESRFITDIRSGAGASGLMQLMPATARWMARKLGVPYDRSMINDQDMNLLLGASYYKRVLDDFGGSAALATAGYNAGPKRPRRWREGGAIMEPAAFAESIPFSETRDYVKKVLSNSVFYAERLGIAGPSLKQRLGAPIGPLARGATPPDKDLP